MFVKKKFIFSRRKENCIYKYVCVCFYVYEWSERGRGRERGRGGKREGEMNGERREIEGER